MIDLHAKLEAVGYRLSHELAHQVVAALRTSPCAGSFLTGAAGAGKTFLAEAVAEAIGARSFFFQAFPGCRKEELYQTILPDADQPSGFRMLDGVLPQAALASREAPTALILDEWDKTHPSTDAFLLDFLQTGRISVPGSQVRARQEHLTVFITLNDERELSEPLLRRLPMIELKPAAPALVAQALGDTHAGHAYLAAAVALYRRSRLVNLSKPVTIQELRQLLDAITHLGPVADWNRLVFQFVTKNWDDHELIKSAESIPLDSQFGGLGAEQPVLDVANYDAGAPPGEQAAGAPRMPRVSRAWLEQPEARTVQADGDRVYGVVPRTDSGYDSVARAVLENTPEPPAITDPADLRIAQVGEQEIIVFEPLKFTNLEQWGLILKDGGELLLETQHGGEVTRRMLQEFRAGQLDQAPDDPDRCRIYAVTDAELLMRYRNVRIRWTPLRLEVVTNEFEPTRELWDFIYGPRGRVTLGRLAQARQDEEAAARSEGPAAESHEQLQEDYLRYLRHYRHLRTWVSLFIERNLRVWNRITCSFQGTQVKGSILPAPDFAPDTESPATREEAESVNLFTHLTQTALDYYESNLAQIESELTLFVAREGEFPPAVEEGGIFALHEIHTDLAAIKREGLKLYMRKGMREA